MQTKSFCEYPFTRVRITAEGNLSFCCFMRPDPMMREEDAYLGNILQNTFDDIWFSPKAEEIRKETLAGRLHKMCQCPGCPYVSMTAPYPKRTIIYNEYPTFLEIDLPNTHCNIGGLSPSPTSPACIMCERSSPFFRPETNRLFEVLEKLKYVVPNLQNIHIQGIAEPFYQTRNDGYLLFEVLDALGFDDYSHKITLGITTNGTLFKKSVRESYLKRAPNSITTFSIDAATPETFKKIRILDCFDKVIENLIAFSQERSKTKQFLQCSNNINTVNVHEVAGMVQIAHKAGVNCVEFNPTNGHNSSILLSRENCGLFARAESEIIEMANKLNLPYKFIRPLDLNITSQLIQITL